MTIYITPENNRVFKLCRKRFWLETESGESSANKFSLFFNCRNSAIVKTVSVVRKSCQSVEDFVKIKSPRAFDHFKKFFTQEIEENELSLSSEEIDDAETFFEQTWSFLIREMGVLSSYEILNVDSIEIPINYGKGYVLSSKPDLVLRKEGKDLVVYLALKSSERKGEILTKMDFLMYTYGIHRKDFKDIRGIFYDLSKDKARILDVQRCSADYIKRFKYDIIQTIKLIDLEDQVANPKSSVCGSCKFSNNCEEFEKAFPEKVSFVSQEKKIIDSGISEMDW